VSGEAGLQILGLALVAITVGIVFATMRLGWMKENNRKEVMMREIKFRGRDLEGQWHYGFLAYENCIADARGGHAVLQSTVGQYTGLKDKNAREIYEGDIIPVRKKLLGEDCKPKWRTFNLAVAWDNVHAGWRLEGRRSEHGATQIDHINQHVAKQCEVIGDIHENPELLEQAADRRTIPAWRERPGTPTAIPVRMTRITYLATSSQQNGQITVWPFSYCMQ
jgi:uncharacterized phage protein (TIGR01671 family)